MPMYGGSYDPGPERMQPPSYPQITPDSNPDYWRRLDDFEERSTPQRKIVVCPSLKAPAQGTGPLRVNLAWNQDFQSPRRGGCWFVVPLPRGLLIKVVTPTIAGWTGTDSDLWCADVDVVFFINKSCFGLRKLSFYMRGTVEDPVKRKKVELSRNRHLWFFHSNQKITHTVCGERNN